jgi:cysteine desulfurase
MTPSAIYLDHNSTTPLDPRVAEAMARAWSDCGANPASQHAPGRKARKIIEEAREGIAALLGAKTGGMDADRLIFTSGGTEANNLIVLGSAPLLNEGDLLISAFEHPSIRGSAERLRRAGTSVTVFASGDDLYKPLNLTSYRSGGTLVSFMLANNETGIVHPLRDIVSQCECFGAHVHTDAVQAVGKIPVNFRALGVDAMTVAPHKFHGPLGIGALLVRHEVTLAPQLFGGFQQAALRPGTENAPLAVGFHEALKLAIADLPDRAAQMRQLRDNLEQTLKAELTNVVVVGESAERLPNTSCIAFPGINRQALVMSLDMAGVACSTGSACASGSSEPSPTLLAMGLPKDVVEGSIRLSLGAFTTAEEVAEAARRISKAVNDLRSRK